MENEHQHIHKKIEYFFPITIDDFFDDPEEIVKFGKSQKKKSDPRGEWPGVRSRPLNEVDEVLQQEITSKIVSYYYDLEYREIFWETSSITFQEIPRFSKNKNDIRHKGWIHSDNMYDWDLAGLVYLTPNIDPDAGTSLFNLKKSAIKSGIYKKHNQELKNLLYRDDHFDKKEYTKRYNAQEKLFFEKNRFQNIFNRAIMYDTREWHRANSYYTGDGEDMRFTMTFFIGGLSEYPLKRIKQRDHEYTIKKQLMKVNNNENFNRY